MKTVVITSWYFNPIHPGYIECLQLCKELGDELWVIVNNDEQAKLKTWKSEVFQDREFRMKVVDSIKGVDQFFLAVDEDWSVCKSIRAIAEKIRAKHWADTKIIFGKWGDRFAWNIPEVQVCEELGIEIRDGLGMKTYNSSDFRAKI